MSVFGIVFPAAMKKQELFNWNLPIESYMSVYLWEFLESSHGFLISVRRTTNNNQRPRKVY